MSFDMQQARTIAKQAGNSLGADMLNAACDEIDALRATLTLREQQLAGYTERLAEVEKERDAVLARAAEAEGELYGYRMMDSSGNVSRRFYHNLMDRVKTAEAREARLRAALESVYEKIAHGDDEHRAWLKAMVCEIVNAALEKAKP